LQQLKVAHLQSTPFLEYSYLYSGPAQKENLRIPLTAAPALRLFDNYEYHVSTTIRLEGPENYSYTVDSDKICLLGGLRRASGFGFVDIALGYGRWRWEAVVSPRGAAWLPVIHLSHGLPVVDTRKW